MTKAYTKIYNCLLAAAVGDAMGAPLKTRTLRMIREDFGGGKLVNDFQEPLVNSPTSGMPAAVVTDAFSAPYILLEHIMENGGKATEKITIEALLNWRHGSATKELHDKFADSVVRRGLNVIEGLRVDKTRDFIFCENKTSSAACCARAWIAGLLHPGNPDKAMEEAFVITLPTHNSWIALSGSAAIAAGISFAFTRKPTISGIVDVIIEYADKAYDLAQEFGRPAAGANVARRVQLGAQIGLGYSSDRIKCIETMNALVGNGVHTNETLPAAVGYFVAGGGDIEKTLQLAVNTGGNTTEIALLAGALAGAFNGDEMMDSAYMEQLVDANDFLDIPALAKKVYEHLV